MHACYYCIYLPVEIAIGFYTDSVSLTSDEASGTVTLSVRVFNGTISEGSSIPVRVTTADNSAHGNYQAWQHILVSQHLQLFCSFIRLHFHFSSCDFF